MKEMTKRLCGILLCAAVVLSLLAGMFPARAASAFTSWGGWNETIYATISGIQDADVKSVSYSGPVSGTLSGEDFEYLVRSTSGGVRVDVLGLKAGTYSLTVETATGTYSQAGIEVPAIDRSGFAHYGNTEGVGAYNDDGTLKDNALVLYVTNSNKNSVEVTCGGVTVKGIGHILNSAGEDVGGGLTNQGGLANNNAGILQKLADANIPLVVRIIGNVTAPDGVTAYSSLDYGGIKGDSGFMVRMRHCKNITIEGVGASGSVDGWGFSFICGTGDTEAGYGKNFEVRNITFDNVPEDCIGFEGTQVGDTLPDPIQRCWAHHNTFNGPYIADAAASDKKNGDGACDWKRGLYYTNSYNYYNAYRKTCLVGSNDDCLQYHATFHHNYWYDCAQRMPLIRQADVHLYNNIWYSAVDYCISPRASCYVFCEYGYFLDNGDVLESSGDVDGYGNICENSKSTSHDITNVADREAAIASGELAGTYVEAGDYILQTDIEEMKQVVYTQTGAQKADSSDSLDPDAPGDSSSSGGGAGGFVHNFTLNGLESAFYTFSGETSTSKGKVTWDGKTLTTCMPMTTADHSVSFNAPVAGTLTMVFGGSTSDKNNDVLVDGSAVTIGDNNAFTIDIAAGEHTVVKSDQVHLWYIEYVPSEEVVEPTLPPVVHEHSYTAAVTTQPGCETAGVRTYTCECGEKYTEAVPAVGHSYGNGYCTVCGAADPNGSAHTHSYTAKEIAPTCTQQGYTSYTCICGDSYADSYVSATGHSYTETLVAPTCTKDGYTVSICACGDSYQSDPVAALGHSYSAAVVAPTCLDQGYTLYSCQRCADSYKDTYTAAVGHNYVSGVCTYCGRPENISGDLIEFAGHLETAYVKWADISGADGYNVYVKKSSASAWTQLDNELIRKYPTYWRADALGLSAGSYTLKVVPLVGGAEQEDAAMVTGNVTVLAHNRDGYAFQGGYVVGAYNPDGTLMAGAKVFYITADTVNTVSITENGKTYTGLGKLVKEYARTTSNPIVIRVIGEIPVPSATTNGQIEVKGNIVPVTIEGVGEDATCNRWGFKLSGCENVEVRNLGFMSNDSSEGDSLTLQNAVRCWTHNCDFFYGEPGSDADQVKGDGALDTKHSQYITHSYHHFWDCGKVNLQGSNSSDTSNYITYHHNWYDHSDSRHPRVRVATVHVYNNFYDGNQGYGVGSTLDSDIFVENNYFRSCARPILISDQGSDTTETMSGEAGGMVKAYGNIMVGNYSFIPYSENPANFDAYVAQSRDEQVPDSVKAINGGASYSNFDTAADFYDYEIMPAADVPQNVMDWAGRVGGGDFQWEFDDATQDTNEEVIPELKAAVLAYKTQLVSVGGNSTASGTEPEEHTHSYTESVTGATCTAQGYTLYTCACGYSYKGDYVNALGHDYVDGVCSRCGDVQTTEPPVTEPPVTEPEPTDPVAPAGSEVHNFTENGTSSTFYSITGTVDTASYTVAHNGLTLSKYLKMQSSTLVSFTAPADGKLVLVFGTEVTGGSYSIKMGISTSSMTTVSLNKQQVLTVDVAAGPVYIKVGSGTSKLFYMAYTPNVVTEHTHSYTASETTAATCETEGVRTYVCSCGESYTEEIPALGHDYSSSVKVPSCEDEGLITYTCSVCGDSYTESIPATGHTAEAVPGKAATCTETGLTEGSACSVCGEVLTAQEEIAALGHSFADGVCGVCGAEDPDYVAPDPSLKQGLQKGEDGEYYYYIDGVVQESYTGLMANSAGRWYILNGHAELSYDGLIEFEGTKYLIKAGRVNTAFTGITKQEGVYYYFAEGVNDLVFEGLVYCNGMKAYVQNGEVNFNKSGVVEDEGNLVYVKYGIWRNTFKGLARTDDAKWIYMANGIFDATYTGVAKLNANWVYVENGYVNFNYSGTITVGAYDYTVKYGIVQF